MDKSGDRAVVKISQEIRIFDVLLIIIFFSVSQSFEICS